MNPDGGRVGDTRLVVCFRSKRLEHALEDSLLVPAGKARVHRLPGTESLGQVSPLNARLRNVNHRIHEKPVRQLGRPAGSVALGRQQTLDAGPLALTEFVTSHHHRRSEIDRSVDPSAPSDLNASRF